MVGYIEHPLIYKNKIESRLYQQVLVADTLKKGNTMVVAPTALGKTIVAVLLSANRLKKFETSKILILAPTKPLAIQHEESFKDFLKSTVTSITGSIKPEERIKRWNESQIICATPQTIESDLINKRYSLENVSLIVFDECHHAVGFYAYVYLANQYTTTAKDSLILALTASPGSNEDKIYKVCENLFIKNIIIKTEEDPDVSPYFNPIKTEWIKLELTHELQDIKDHLNKALNHRLKRLKSNRIIKNTNNIGKRELLDSRDTVQNHIARSTKNTKKYYKFLSIIAASINIQHSLELLETQGISTLHQYLNRLEKKTTKAAKNLINDPDFSKAIKLTQKALNNNIEHPKLEKLISILKEELKTSNKIIVFTQYRDTAELINKACIKEEGIKSVKFYGQSKRDEEKGLTQKQQKEIIDDFKQGKYDVLISTSVAEEGIDIPSVDLVILYEPVPSEIRMIQRRGRTGRKKIGKLKILITKDTRDETYYWASINKEKNMKRDLENLNKIKKIKKHKKLSFQSKLTQNTEKSTDISQKINMHIKDSIREDMQTTAHDTSITGGSADFEDYLLEMKNKTLPIKPKVIADSREVNSRVLRELSKLGIDVILETLAIGDYQITDDLIIERKTVSDFISSILDKRLYKQAKDMVDNFKKPVIILEGDDLYSSFINPNAVRGALASIAIDFGIPVLPTRNSEDTAIMIKRIIIYEQNQNEPIIQIRTEKKPLTLLEQKLFIIESLPNIGSVTARRLLEKFGNVKNIINASEKELEKVEGIGEKTAKQILKILNDNTK